MIFFISHYCYLAYGFLLDYFQEYFQFVSEYSFRVYYVLNMTKRIHNINTYIDIYDTRNLLKLGLISKTKVESPRQQWFFSTAPGYLFLFFSSSAPGNLKYTAFPFRIMIFFACVRYKTEFMLIKMLACRNHLGLGAPPSSGGRIISIYTRPDKHFFICYTATNVYRKESHVYVVYKNRQYIFICLCTYIHQWMGKMDTSRIRKKKLLM